MGLSSFYHLSIKSLEKLKAKIDVQGLRMKVENEASIRSRAKCVER